MDEVTQRDSKDPLIVKGYKISHMNGRTTYSFKDSLPWAEAKTHMKHLEDMIKTATERGTEVSDPSTGTFVEPVTKSVGKAYLKMEVEK